VRFSYALDAVNRAALDEANAARKRQVRALLMRWVSECTPSLAVRASDGAILGLCLDGDPTAKIHVAAIDVPPLPDESLAVRHYPHPLPWS
jgi:hypothetical protein